MNLTNKLNLPAAIVRAVGVDGYKPGRPGTISITTLLAPAYLKRLEHDNAELLEEDASDRIWSMMGQLGHLLAERSADFNSLSEERLYATIGGVEVSGQVDLYDKDGVVSDFKFTTAYKSRGSEDWTAQLNCYGWLLRKAGFPVTGLRIIAVFRDWSRAKADSDPSYPQQAVGVIPCELWSDSEVEAFLAERIAVHTSAFPPPCTDEERWATAPVFAVMKDGRKSAVKLHESRAVAEAHATDLGKGHSVVERPRQYKRCEAYCRASAFCPVWRAHQKLVEGSHD